MYKSKMCRHADPNTKQQLMQQFHNTRKPLSVNKIGVHRKQYNNKLYMKCTVAACHSIYRDHACTKQWIMKWYAGDEWDNHFGN